MTNKQIILAVRRELKKNIDSTYDLQRFFKKRIKFYGVRSSQQKKIAREFFKLTKDKPLAEFLCICEDFLKSGYLEEISLGLGWAFKRRQAYKKSDWRLFEAWLKKYINNWASCDGLSLDLLAWFIIQYPDLISCLKQWTKSGNGWVRRAAAVSLIEPVRSDKKFLKDVFEIADVLLLDQHDLVQKGYGWMLKEAANLYQKEVFDFVMARKHKMPRTALRYAIEKMPERMRKRAMS